MINDFKIRFFKKCRDVIHIIIELYLHNKGHLLQIRQLYGKNMESVIPTFSIL